MPNRQNVYILPASDLEVTLSNEHTDITSDHDTDSHTHRHQHADPNDDTDPDSNADQYTHDYSDTLPFTDYRIHVCTGLWEL